MRQKLQAIELTFCDRFSIWYVAIAASLMSIAAFVVFSLSGLTLTYNDAMSHLNLSRLVVDNIEPGLSQIGGVWLPLTHILPLLLIWNDTAWQTGLATSIFSMIAYVVSVVGVYQIVFLLSRKIVPSLIASLVFALNSNMLYLQATALTESVYVAFFVLSALFFVEWVVKRNDRSLILLGFMGFLQVLTRYDGWFVVIIEGVLVGIISYVLFKKSLYAAFGRMFLFSFPVVFGIGLWFLWNLLIFRDPLFFMFGEYSARSQQEVIDAQSGLLTKGNLFFSAKAYFFAMFHNIGLFPMLMSGAGLGVFLLRKFIRISWQVKAAVLVFLLAPILFNVIALYLGFSILNVPELNWNPSQSESGKWFNVRYGILALPLFCVLCGIFASWRRLAGVIVLEILLAQMLFYPGEMITITDGTIGSSAYRYQDVSGVLRAQVRDGDRVVLSMSYFNPIAFRSDIKLKQVIHEGASKSWPKALKTPDTYARFVVAANSDTGEPVYTHLIKPQNKRFLAKYSLVYRGREANIYRLKNDTAQSQLTRK